MSNKTPYEIRSELLHLANSICQAQHLAACGKRTADAQAAGEKVDNIITSAPTTAEIIAEAAKLNEFVSGTKS